MCADKMSLQVNAMESPSSMSRITCDIGIRTMCNRTVKCRVFLLLLLIMQCAILTGAHRPGPGPGNENSSTVIATSITTPISSGPTSTTAINVFLSTTSIVTQSPPPLQTKSRSVDTRVQFEVEEEEPVGTVLGRIPTKVGFTYRFNEMPKEFELNGTSGVITTAAVLDRESLPTNRFDLVILSSQPTYPIEVRIVILDINDNFPTFPESSIKVSFSESATPGTRVILDTATDRDAGFNSVTTDYEIVSGNDDEKFRLIVITNPSGETPYLNLETASPLDRENRASYQLNISAQDGGRVPLVGFLIVNITVLDVNDNPPIFDHSDYVVSLNETVPPGTGVLQVRATDTDEGENARITYYLADSETRFEVDADTGVIRTQESRLSCRQNCPAGRNCPKSCVFTVFAHDNGSPRQDGRTYVTVNLMDANDHDPIIRFRYFPSTGSFATVDENAHNGSVVAAVSVIDPDDGSNGETIVQIRAGNERDHFHMEHTPSFDIVRVNGVLDREKTEKYNLTIVATDKGSPPRSSTAFLIIRVNDVNDHAPVFERGNYSSVLGELVPVGTYVSSVTATDQDTGINSKVYYAIVSGNERQWFDIDIVSGLIITARHLDRELQSSVTLKLSARDGGPSPRWAYTYVQIEILDENDEVPRFNNTNLNASIIENSPANTPVITVKAVDGDQGVNGSIVYTIDTHTEQMYPGVFSVNSSTGLVTSRVQLDKEDISVYMINVVAKDRGVPPLSSTITINLNLVDVNDNDPIFYPIQYFATVEENANPGTSVLQVKANDPDEGQHSDLKFSIVDGGDGAFEIDTDHGIVRTTSKLSKWSKSQYRLTVVAKDLGDRKTSENAVVDIVVENNQVHHLEFSQPTGYKFNVLEDFGGKEPSLGRVVGRISASSAEGSKIDVGHAVKYNIISGDEKHVFAVDENTGTVTTSKQIDREEKVEYSIIVLAQSGLNYGAVTVVIVVDDVNDNFPLFQKGGTAVTAILENCPVGHEVYSANVEDLDFGANGEVSYTLSYNPDEVFSINERSGMIYLKKSVDYELKNKYEVEVMAVDNGRPPLSSKQRITIMITDINDHTPLFEHLSVETSLSEGTPVNDRFFALTATDDDSGLNGLVSYAIIEGTDNSKFGIFPDGNLYVRSVLDREVQSYYELVVVGRDHGQTVSRSSSVIVVIHIQDENDNAPQFSNKTFTFNLLENEPPDTYIGQLEADDRDIGRNAELTFSIGGNHEGFIVDPKSGIIKSTQYFDHEKLALTSGQNFVTLEAYVTDNGLVRQQDEAKIFVYIADVNDNSPQFVRLPYKTTMSEYALAKSPVLRVSATDADEGSNGRITYSIRDGNVDGQFDIDRDSGQIVLIKPLDRENSSEYELIVVAKDDGHPKSLSASTTVIVQVLDENDNAPRMISTQTEISVIENATIGTELMEFSARDADLGLNAQLAFYIGAGNIQETFRIDSVTGKLYLNKGLDRETRTSYTLNMTVTDGGTPHLMTATSFTIHVLDVNDNAPSFSNVAIVRQIQEGIPVNTPVVTVMALDPDAGPNGKVQYALVGQEPASRVNLFAIRPETGVIYTVNEIDREFSDTFRLTVMASDLAGSSETRPLSAEKLVTVIVEDVNDNAPKFVSLHAAVLPLPSEKGFTIMTLSAIDVDANENGKVSYELVKGDVGPFVLDRHSGRLSSKRRIDGPAGVHLLTVRASDGAIASQRKYAEMQVSIVGVPLNRDDQGSINTANSGIHAFSKPEYVASIPENETVGLSVVTLNVGSLTNDAKVDIAYYVTGIISKGVAQPRVFDVDRRSGVLTTAAVLDHESGYVEYVVSVIAVDRSHSMPVTSWTKVIVTLLDKNDSPPIFVNVSSSTIWSVSEDSLPGHVVGHFTAKDPDTFGTLSYRILSIEDDLNKFTLDASTGVLTVSGTLDRETTSRYQLTVEASDGTQSAVVTINVIVTDSNDNAPTFVIVPSLGSAYSFNVKEDAVRGARVGAVSATDPDEAANAQLTYTVISDWANDVFSLNPQTGVFTLTSHLDYEQTQHYIFVVQAQDSGQTRLSSTVSVYINVLDLNDNAPLFDPMSYSDEVFENVTVGTTILKVSATDQDSGENGDIVYSIVNGNDCLCFDITDNGTIYTIKPLDREVQSFYNLFVMAEDRAGLTTISNGKESTKRLSSTTQVNIILKDVNDNAPQFVTPNVTSVMENIQLDTVVMAVKAIDSDEGRNSYVEYSLTLTASNSDLMKFTIGPVDGLLKVNAVLDREVASQYIVRVTARDRGFPTKSTEMDILVKVLDENDNGPIFDPVNYSATVAENASTGMSILQVSATDQDYGINSRLRYSIVAGDKNHDFSISEDSGVVRVVNDLDYETRSAYVLTVQVEDGGAETRYDSATVTISVTDHNDNPPVFVDSPYVVHVLECVDTTTATYVTARDYDTPPNAQVRYFLKDGDQGLFGINGTTGKITVRKSLDRETQNRYELVVIAMDSGTPRLTGTGTVQVLVDDINDNDPQFLRSEYVTSLSENLLPNTSILTVTATDLDDGQNAIIRYSLLGDGEERFKMNALTGDIFSRISLDREERNIYELTILATDAGLTETRNATAKLIIAVTDENDNAPRFERDSYSVFIPDPTVAGQYVFGATALDIDFGHNSRLSYELLGEDANKFSLKNDSGVVMSAMRLTGTDKVYRFKIKVSDGGTPSLSTSASVEVKLKPSDNFPSFKPSLSSSFTLSELDKNKIVTNVSGVSPKSGPVGQITYRISGGNVGDVFTIDPSSGELSVSGVLDYEVTTDYEVWIEAIDGDDPPVRSVISFNISITDANDNTPKFVNQIYNASVPEEESPPLTVLSITATDDDSGDNGKFSYRLSDDGNADGAFSIDSRTGRIFTNSKLDRETLSVYTLVVEAIDSGIPANTGQTTIYIQVTDKNDNPPRFTRLFSANVTENAEIGAFVIQVTSSDRDIGPNANASYSFTENPDGRFRIDPISGNVTVASRIDRETRDEYILKVSALDGSWRAETPLTITVQDVNDNAPQFEFNNYTFNFPELQANIAFVGKLLATDRDKQGPNAYVSYSLKQTSDYFDIDPSSGEIFSKHSLKYKHTRRGPSPENRHSLMVLGKDHGKPPLTSECLVTVHVVDSNDNAPSFTQTSYFSPVPASASSGMSIIRIWATDDADYGANAQISYSIVNGNGSKYFSIDVDSGWITVASDVSQLSDQQGNSLILKVKATDKGVPPQSVETTVTFVVTGENRFGPAFSSLNYQVILPEDENVGSEVITLSATDTDSGMNGQVVYNITGGNDDGKFKIDPLTGRVSIVKLLDFEDRQEYKVNVTAEDRGFHAKLAVVQLSIVVTDANDNAPLFDRPIYDAYITENNKWGVSVLRLTATDADSSRHAVIQYTIVGGDGKDQFAIDPQTGVITTLATYDLEEKESYSLEVLASNPDTAQYSSTKVIVHVRGVNEFYPSFVQSVFQFTVSESSPVGTSVGNVMATDKDAGEDGQVLYLFVGSSSNRGFVVNSQTGVVYVSRRLDRESLSRIVLTVLAKNSGPIRGNDTDEAQVVIRVQDGNDPPVFSENHYEVRLSEDTAVGSKVTTVQATDRDTRPANSRFTYSIIAGNREGAFNLDPLSGEIITATGLDQELTPIYNLTIAAIDSGVPPQTGTTVLKVYIDDINDNGPFLDPPNQLGTVFEDEPADTVVIKLTVSDPDLPPNGAPFLFAIVGGEHKDSFSIDQTKGLVKTRRPLDREMNPELQLLIEVSDAGNPPMKSTFPLLVRVRDKNDNPSHPRNVTVLVYVLPDSDKDVRVASLHPMDADTDNDFRCQILSSSSSSDTTKGIFSVREGCNIYGTFEEFDTEQTLKLTGNDGLHSDVPIVAQVIVKSVSNETINNCVTVRIPNITASDFVGNHLSTLSLTMNELLSPLRSSAFVFSVAEEKGDIEVFIGGLKLDEAGSDVSVVRNHELAQMLSGGGLGRTLGRSLTVDYDPCDDSPCENGAQCASKIIITAGNSSIAGSNALILSSSQIRRAVICKCQTGFTGDHCEYRTDPCSPNPCQHGGSCSRDDKHGFVCSCLPSYRGITCDVERTDACIVGPCKNGGTCQETQDGNYFCMCRPGFRGGLCEVISDSCRPSPCDNGGTCVATQPGFRCQCRAGFYGRHCERSSRGFHELSYVALPTLNANANDISIVFSTTKSNGLLVYNYGSQVGGRSDFLALEILDGRLKFSFGGARTAINALKLDNGTVSDGNWYKVIVTRNGRVASMLVSNCWDNGVSCNECLPGDLKCSTEQHGHVGALNFNSKPMYLGGIPSIRAITDRPGQLQSDDFIGCIHSVAVDGQLINLASEALSSRGTSDTCPRTESTCRGSPCGGSGRCIDQWFEHVCVCENDILAPNCNDAFLPVTLDGGAYVEFRVGEKHRRHRLLGLSPRSSQRRQRSVLKQSSLSLHFRTSVTDVILLYLATNEDYTIIYIRSNLLHYTSKLGSHQPVNVTLTDVNVSNGEWHNVSLINDGSGVYIDLNNGASRKQIDTNEIHEFLDPYLTKVIVGLAEFDLLGSNELPLSGFEGCIGSFVVDGELQSLNASAEDGSFFKAFAGGRVKSGCIGPVQVQGALATDPLSVGITLVIIFFLVLIITILASFVLYKRRRHQQNKNTSTSSSSNHVHHNHHHHHHHHKSNGNVLLGNSLLDSTSVGHHDSGYIEAGVEPADDPMRNLHFNHQELVTKKYKEREVTDQVRQHQRPDIIERENIVNKPPVMPRTGPSMHGVAPNSDVGLMKDCGNVSSVSAIQDSEAPEHYDLENASSIAPSDIDIVYHYKGYRDGQMRKYRTNGANQLANFNHKHVNNNQTAQQAVHRHSPHVFPPSGVQLGSRHSPAQCVLKMQSTPLARLSPSSEMSQQTTPRILTLQDISGRPLQSALLGTSQGRVDMNTCFKERPVAAVTNSERSLNSPVSHLSQNSCVQNKSPSNGVTGCPKKMKGVESSTSSLLAQAMAIGLTAEEIERLNTRPRNSSLVSTLDAVSSSSSSSSSSPRNHRHRQHHNNHHHHHNNHHHNNHQVSNDKMAELMETNTELLETADTASSTDESGNDSFTCSEFEYENNYDRPSARDFRCTTGNMIFSKLAEVDNENENEADVTDFNKSYVNGLGDGFDSFRGSLSTLVASDDDVIVGSHNGVSSSSAGNHLKQINNPNGSAFRWDCLLNWGPSFESMVGVFKDIAELPDSGSPSSAATTITRPSAAASGKLGEEYV